MSTAVVILADGFEEIEAITQIDVLRRAGVEVTVAGLRPGIAEGAHGIGVATDLELTELTFEPDLVVLPGGLPGSERLGDSQAVVNLLRRQHAAGRMIGAICAAPAFAPVAAGILDGKHATCYPSFERHFDDSTTALPDRVVVDGNVITSRGPGTALEFALEMVAELVGDDAADELRSAMLVSD
jgi:4-methyl-5(b-hydroxyethyl)-thiazole monophosphate biosynthesis